MSISEPSKIVTPWASTGSKNPIPQTANNTTGAAGFDKGFPDITMTPEEAGGLPPAGQDFNGIFYQITDIIRYMQAGGQPTFNSDMAAAIGGYPKGAVIIGNDKATLWRSDVDSNSSNPNLSAGSWSQIDVGLRGDLHSISGASLVGSASYADVRAYAGAATVINVYGRVNVFDGAFGTFDLDATDITSLDNGGTILVDALGRRWKRRYTRSVNLLWFADPSSTDCYAGIMAAYEFAKSTGYRAIYAPSGVWTYSSTLDFDSPMF